MCGIAGFCSFRNNYLSKDEFWNSVLEKMRQSIDHRGGDQSGKYLKNVVGFAHSRLSIRDIDGGKQPMTRMINGYHYTIIYNGEIYNTDEIEKPLIEKGYIFDTTGDTEVILYSYIENGPEFVNKLNGIFAFAIFDERTQQLLMYRDRVGVKPLFYTVKNNEIVFGSEIKAIFKHPNISPRINDDSFREILGVGPARTPGCGVFEDIKEVLPGSYLVFSKSDVKQYTYWKLEAHEHTDSYKETLEKVLYLVRDSVEKEMVADIPVCTFLSGGLDSSIVTAIASKYLENNNQTLNTFSFDFEGNDEFFTSNKFQPSRDRPFVEKMISLFPLNHNFLMCKEEKLADLLESACIAKDLPGMTDVDSSLLYFCAQVKKSNKVVLTGECADEIFGGYPWFYRKELLESDGFPWSCNISARNQLLNEKISSKLDLYSYSHNRYEETIKEAPKLDGESKNNARLRDITYLNMRWFMLTLLERMDRMSMFSGLEARVPFADHRIIEYLYNVPWNMKYQNGVEKYLLRDACNNLLPEELLWRKKSPYPKTYDPKYELALIENMKSVIQNPNMPVNKLLNKNKVLEFLSSPKNYGEPWFGQLMAGPQMIAYLLQINYWMLEYNLEL